MDSKLEEKLTKYIKETENKLEKLEAVRKEVNSYSLDYNKIECLKCNDVYDEIIKQRKTLRNLKTIKKRSSELCIDEKIYITDDIYFQVSMRSKFDDYKLNAHFYFDYDRSSEKELYEKFYSSHTGLNKMMNAVLSSTILMLLQEEYGMPMLDLSSTINSFELDKIEKICDILKDKHNWKVIYLQETASSIITKILNHADEYEA